MNCRIGLLSLFAFFMLPGCAGTMKTVSCSFSNTMNQWGTANNCIVSDTSGAAVVSSEVLMQLEFDPTNDLAPILLAEGWAYIDRAGVIAIRNVPSYDNGPEPFKDGLLRMLVSDKYGFVDAKGTAVIPANYDGAFAFDQGYTSVCTGCTVESNGDYHEFSGGKWLCINTKGETVAETFCESE